MAARIREAHGVSMGDAEQLAQEWAALITERLPEAQGTKFRTEHEIASVALADILAARQRRSRPDEARELVRRAWSEFAAKCALQPDVSVRWLRGLRSRTRGLGLVTDGDSDAVFSILTRLKLVPVFDSVITSEEVGSYKPDCRIFQAALNGLHAIPNESLFVSDSARDLEGAAAVGLATALIPRAFPSDATKVPSAAIVLTRLPDIDAIIDQFAKTGRFGGH